MKLIKVLGAAALGVAMAAGTAQAETTIRVQSVLPDTCLLYTSPSPRDATLSRMPSSA